MRKPCEKFLIVNADDFGLNKEINEGILYCFKKGVITDATLLLNHPYTEHAAELAKKNKLPVGIHFNLTYGKPVSNPEKVRALLKNDGNFHGPVFLGFKSFFSENVKKQIEIELETQIKGFLNYKLSPIHFDSHQYIHAYPWVCSIVIKLARKYNVESIRCSYEGFPSAKFKIKNLHVFFRQFFQTLYVSFFSYFSKKLILRSKIKTTDHYVGIMQICSKSPAEAFSSIIENLKPGTTEIMTHPGFVHKNDFFYNLEREKELETWTSENMEKLLKKHNIKLISFSQL